MGCLPTLLAKLTITTRTAIFVHFVFFFSLSWSNLDPLSHCPISFLRPDLSYAPTSTQIRHSRIMSFTNCLYQSMNSLLHLFDITWKN
ncbi:hypothetical protein EDB82DRAFT_496061 [Fusarium venenatum]|uniref:uncharacterized protein n=1 Tax=Fusarium venenatum TaxID=56646 RepID=UPI001DD39FAC|nr:hypothetical protein EDB82DRAFT_496061 [Fusarium venenatum]